MSEHHGEPIDRRGFIRKAGSTAGAFGVGALGTATTGPAQASAVGGGTASFGAPTYSDRQGFNRRWYADHDRLSIARPTTAADVLHAFRTAPFDPQALQVTCGRHCYESFVYNGRTRGIIDVTGLKDYGESMVDGHDTIHVGVGMGNWHMYRLLNNVYTKTLPAGSCYSVGLGGHITGGGYGYLSRLYGLSIDHLAAVDIVVPNAGRRASDFELIEQCSESHHPNLFWAVRGGGGGQFGIITRYYFFKESLPTSPSMISTAMVPVSWSDVRSSTQFSDLVSLFYEDYCAEQVPWSRAGAMHANHRDHGTLSYLDIEILEEPDVRTFKRKREADLRRLRNRVSKIAPLSDRDTALHGHPHLPSMRALGIVGSAGGAHYYTFLEGLQQLNGSGPNRRGKYKSAYHKAAFSPSMLDAMYRGLTAPVPGADMSASLVQVDSYGGRINHGGFSPTDTAIPQRSSTAKLQYQTYWDTTLLPRQTDRVLEKAHVGWINALYTDVYAESGGFPDPARNPDVDGCYNNYPDIDLGSAEPDSDQTVEHATRLYFGLANQKRLVSVCRDYDPRGWLTNSQSVWNLLP